MDDRRNYPGIHLRIKVRDPERILLKNGIACFASGAFVIAIYAYLASVVDS